jgi:ribosomal protein S18 acetylase RimI-like enzyme
MAELGTARHDDLPQLVFLLGLLFSEEADFVPDAGKQQRALELLIPESAAGTIFVARERAQAVAMASLIYTVSTAEGGKAALFEDLIVHPDYRGRGIATALVRFVINEARQREVLRLTLLTDMQNARAQALYRKLGFADSSMKPMRLKL